MIPTPTASWPRRPIRRQRSRVQRDDAPHAVYSLFDDVGELIYVGMSHDPERRIRSHLGKSWGNDARSWSADWYRNRADAARAEAALIQAQKPKYNTFGTPRQGQVISAAYARSLERASSRGAVDHLLHR